MSEVDCTIIKFMITIGAFGIWACYFRLGSMKYD